MVKRTILIETDEIFKLVARTEKLMSLSDAGKEAEQEAVAAARSLWGRKASWYRIRSVAPENWIFGTEKPGTLLEFFESAEECLSSEGAG